MKNDANTLKRINDYIFEHAALFQVASDSIWNKPELALEENYAVSLYTKILSQAGFEIESGLAGLDTAFSASFGSGSPVIGILGEYDALPEMSQLAGVTEKAPVKAGEAGHACGHNLLGVASMAAAMATKDWLENTKNSGTVVFFGCPAEEKYSGKAHLANAGCFDDLDAAITWHPTDINAVFSNPTLANCTYRFAFKGTSAHASFTPHLGRSALDALELMCVGTQYLREHVKKDVGLHYAITNTGGHSPNIVQDNAEALFQIRSSSLDDVLGVGERLLKVAEGAALMTETEVECELISSCESLLPNTVLSQALHNEMCMIEPPQADAKEKEYAEALRASMETSDSLSKYLPLINQDEHNLILEHLEQPFNDFILPFMVSEEAVHFSTDVGNVSWVCPVAQICSTTACAGTAGHTWQQTAQGKSSFAHKGMLYAAKVMANTTARLILKPEILLAAKKEFDHRREISAKY